MYILKYLAASALALGLMACGGGGGSAGSIASTGSTATGTSTASTTTSGAGTVTTSGSNTPTPTLSLELRDATGATSFSVVAGASSNARVQLKDASGAAVANKLVSFTSDPILVKMSPASGQVLTNALGIATVQINPASLSANGASTINASSMVAGVALSAAIDFQLSPSNLTLSTLDVGSGNLPAFGNRLISALATINGVAATNTPVQISFSASCGTVSPALVSTDSSGKAQATYKADNANCSGTNVTIGATALGATALNATVAVSAAVATNLQFVGASPELIYLAGAGGASQSQVRFKVVDANGAPLNGQSVNVSFASAVPGISLDTLSSTSAVAKTSDSNGLISVAVFSGTVPTPVQLKASLASNALIETFSGILTVASGRATQKGSSLSAEKFSIEGLNTDGIKTKLTMSLSDRQGNPVPDGAVVNFVTSAGVMVPATCVIGGGSSQCTVEIRSQGTRPSNGRVAVMAYIQGEEDFIDANFNNIYDAGESFTDLGNAFRDDNFSSSYDIGEFTVPRAGTVVCTNVSGGDAAGGVNSRPLTCDGVWGSAEVRRQLTIIFASDNALITRVGGGASVSTARFSVSDTNGNSMPTGTTFAASKSGSSADGCSIVSTTPSTLPNRTGPSIVTVSLKGCVATDGVVLTVTSPLGTATSNDPSSIVGP